MVTYSNDKPNDYDINIDENQVITATLYKNIQQTDNYYRSESTSIVVENQDDIGDYIMKNFDTLFSQGLEKENELKEKKEEIK